MSIISKQAEIQEELHLIYNEMTNERGLIENDLKQLRSHFSEACDLHMNNGFSSDKKINKINTLHENKFIEYDIYCLLLEIINDFKDLNSNFPEYTEMHETLLQVMIQLADKEEYEQASIIKTWVDRIYNAIKQ